MPWYFWCMAQENLLSAILQGAEDTEFLSLLQDLYGPGGIDSRTSVVYPSSRDHVFRVRSDDVEITSVEPGPRCTSAEIDRVRTAVRLNLIESPGTKVGVGTLFSSSHPVLGAFRCDDRLQILPAPEGAPRPPFAGGLHPFLIEFLLRQSRDRGITNTRRMRGIVEWAWLLNLFLRYGVRFLSPRARYMWAISADPGEMTDFSHARYVQEGYPDLAVERLEYSSPGPDLISIVPHNQYYSDNNWIDPGKGVAIPDSLPRLVDAAESLPRGQRRRFMRAAQWFYGAREVWEHHTSLTFLALATAIETMTPSEPPDPCPTCGKDRSPGPTQRFRRFVDQYDPVPVGTRRPPFYDTRSGLSHGSLLLYHDELPWSRHSSGRGHRELTAHYELFETTRRALVNWLLGQASRPTASVSPVPVRAPSNFRVLDWIRGAITSATRRSLD